MALASNSGVIPFHTSDTKLEAFAELTAKLSNCSGHKERSSVISSFLRNGTDGSLHRESKLMLKLLLPKTTNRKFNIQDKQLVNYFSEIFRANRDDMMLDLENGDIAATLVKFFMKSGAVKPLTSDLVTLKEVDGWLDALSNANGDKARSNLLRKYTGFLTPQNFKLFIRFIKKDLHINAGAKQILDALHPQAYSAFQASHDLEAVVEMVRNSSTISKQRLGRSNISISIKLMTPIKPMLAEPGRSVDDVIAKSSRSGGLLAEIKYDGERVQVHKKGNEYMYFSRSLKPVQSNKVDHLKNYIPQAFPGAEDLILDAEILLLDTKTQKPLPFGTLGVHKRTAFVDATVCLFVFDCLYINGGNLLLEPLHMRREIMEQNMKSVPNRVLLSEKYEVKTKQDLNALMARVFADGLEGLVIKPKNGIYEPGKRHWIKIKKDYLGEGAVADSADLIVLGAYLGTGNLGGLKSVFLMGAYDPAKHKFCTVTKVGNGLDTSTIMDLNQKLKMIKISKDLSKVPDWLVVAPSLVPDFIVADPRKSPVWEITGAEFSRSKVHTAGMSDTQDGISIRFPRITRQRPDKTWLEATDVSRLGILLAASRTSSDWSQRLEKITNTSKESKINGSPKRVLEELGDENTESAPPAKKPRLRRVRDSRAHNSPRPLLKGFVITAPKGLIDDSSFEPLYRRLIGCGADVLGDGLPASNKEATHAIVWPDSAQLSPPSKSLIPVTVEWLEQSINEDKLQPLPAT